MSMGIVMQRQGVWVVVALLLGLGGGYWIGHGSRPVMGPPMEVDPGPEAGGEAVPAPELRVAEAPPAVGEDADAATPALVTEGRGVIAGTVTGPDGAPLERVVVLARPQQIDPFYERKPGAPPPPDRGPDEAARAAATHARALAQGTRRSTTGGDGTYRLERLGPGPFHVLAYRHGYRLDAGGEARGWGIRPDATIDFKARAIATVHIELVGPDEQPVLRAEVTAHGVAGAPSGGRRRWTPEHPWMETAPGTFDMEATSDGLKSERQRVTVEAGGSATVRLVLRGRPGLAGAIRIAEPLHRQRPDVHALALDVEDPPTPEDLFGRGRRGRRRERPTRARIARDGSGYVFEELAPGRWLVGLSFDRRELAAHAEITVGEGRATHDFDIPPFDRAAWLRVRVVDTGGKPVSNASVAHGFEGPTMSMGGEWALRLADGSFMVKRALDLSRMRNMAALPEGKHLLRVQVRDGGTKQVEFDPKRDDELVITYEASVRPQVEVVGVDRLPTGCTIGFQDSAAFVGIGHRGKNDALPASGRFEAEPLQPGEHSCVIIYQPQQPASDTKGQSAAYRHALQIVVPVEVRAGQRELRVVVPPLRRVTVKRTGDTGFTLVSVGGAERSTHQIVMSTSGGGESLDLLYVPDGRYEVEVYDRTTRTKAAHPLTVAGSDTTFEIP